MQEIDDVVSSMRNGDWHNLRDLTKRSKLPKPKTSKILEFLANYNFIELDSAQKRAKIAPSLIRFLEENQKC